LHLKELESHTVELRIQSLLIQNFQNISNVSEADAKPDLLLSNPLSKNW
jgi:hypothetical protein